MKSRCSVVCSPMEMQRAAEFFENDKGRIGMQQQEAIAPGFLLQLKLWQNYKPLFPWGKVINTSYQGRTLNSLITKSCRGEGWVDQEHVIYKKAVGAKPHEDELALSCFVGLLSSRCSQLERSVVSHHERVTLVESTFLKGIMKDMTLANPEDWIFLKFLMECYVIESVQALYIKQRWKKDS